MHLIVESKKDWFMQASMPSTIQTELKYKYFLELTSLSDFLNNFLGTRFFFITSQ